MQNQQKNVNLIGHLSFQYYAMPVKLLWACLLPYLENLNLSISYARQKKITAHIHIDCSYMPVEQTERSMKYGPNPVLFIHL